MAGIILNGSVIKGLILNGSPVTAILNGVKVFPTENTPVDPYNPLNLPANTVRVRTSDGNAPVKESTTSYETATLVSGTTDVYDVYKSGTNFSRLLYKSSNVIEVLGANTTGITNMTLMFGWCSSLTTVPLFDTSNLKYMDSTFSHCSVLTSIPLFNTPNVTDMGFVFEDCYLLTNVPLFDTSKVTKMSYMFSNCYKVQSGALALYQKASSQTNPPTNYRYTFRNCGRDTVNGAAELAQIPSDWK